MKAVKPKCDFFLCSRCNYLFSCEDGPCRFSHMIAYKSKTTSYFKNVFNEPQMRYFKVFKHVKAKRSSRKKTYQKIFSSLQSACNKRCMENAERVKSKLKKTRKEDFYFIAKQITNFQQQDIKKKKHWSVPRCQKLNKDCRYFRIYYNT